MEFKNKDSEEAKREKKDLEIRKNNEKNGDTPAI